LIFCHNFVKSLSQQLALESGAMFFHPYWWRGGGVCRAASLLVLFREHWGLGSLQITNLKPHKYDDRFIFKAFSFPPQYIYDFYIRQLCFHVFVLFEL